MSKRITNAEKAAVLFTKPIREEALSAVYEVFTSELGFSTRRVEAGIRQVIKLLAKKDAASICLQVKKEEDPNE